MIPMVWVVGKHRNVNVIRAAIWALEGPSFLVALITSRRALEQARDGIRPDLIIIDQDIGLEVSHPRQASKCKWIGCEVSITRERLEEAMS